MTNLAPAHRLLCAAFLGNSPGGINHAFWSIAVEWHIYFLFPAIVYGWRRFGLTKTATVTFLTGYALSYALRHTAYIGLTPWYLGLFMFGISAAVIGRETHSQYYAVRFWGIAAWVFAIIVALACCLISWDRIMGHYAFVDLPVGLCAACVLVCVSEPTHSVHRVLSYRPLVWIGAFAYSVYLVHAPLVQVVWQYLLNPLHLSDTVTFFLLATVGSVLILGVAYLFHLAFERPFMSKPGVKIKTEAQAEIAAAANPAP